MSYLGILTFVHTALSILALPIGALAVRELFQDRSPLTTRNAFIALAFFTSATGFLFPFQGMTPGIATGIVAFAVLAVMQVASRRLALAGAWRRIYAFGLVASLYLLVFVTIVQAFLKVPFLHRMAPTGSEIPFLFVQAIALGFFVLLGAAAGSSFAADRNTRYSRPPNATV